MLLQAEFRIPSPYQSKCLIYLLLLIFAGWTLTDQKIEKSYRHLLFGIISDYRNSLFSERSDGGQSHSEPGRSKRGHLQGKYFTQAFKHLPE